MGKPETLVHVACADADRALCGIALRVPGKNGPPFVLALPRAPRYTPRVAHGRVFRLCPDCEALRWPQAQA